MTNALTELNNLPVQFDDESAGKDCNEHVLLAWTSAASDMYTTLK